MGVYTGSIFLSETILNLSLPNPRISLYRYQQKVLVTGIEPARSCEHMVLNHARLPIPPPEQESCQKKRVKIKIVFPAVQGFHIF